MLTIEKMWRLVSKTILLLINLNDIVIANYILDTTEVTYAWKDAQKICNVPSIEDILITQKYTDQPKTFTAWTSSWTRKSYWTSFYGCLDVSVVIDKSRDIKTILNQYFPKSTNATTSDSVFKCAHVCTTESDYFTFFKHYCKCIHENEIKSHLEMHPVCIIPNLTNIDNVEEVYSMSRSSLPIFRFETDLRTMIIQKNDTESREYQCLTKGPNDTLTSNDCKSGQSFRCADDTYGFGTWGFAINKCLLTNESLFKEQSNFKWLKYFLYEKDKGNKSCVAVKSDFISCSLTYQYRPCSEQLPVVCRDTHNSLTNQTESTFYKICNPIPTSTKILEMQRPDEKNETFGKIVYINVVLLGLCIISVIMFIIRKRFHTHAVSRNPIIQTGVQSERNIVVSPNEDSAVRGSSNEPLELQRNDFHIAQIDLQEIVTVTMGETEI